MGSGVGVEGSGLGLRLQGLGLNVFVWGSAWSGFEAICFGFPKP